MRPSALTPWPIETLLNEQVRRSNPEVVNIFLEYTPLRRTGKPEDIVGPANLFGFRPCGLCHRLDRHGLVDIG